MPAENTPRRARETLDDLLSTLAKLPEPATEELRDAVRAMGIDPGQAVAGVRELMATKEREARLLSVSSAPAPAGPRTLATGVGRSPRWVDRRFVKVGTCAGTLAGICCLGKAVTVGAGLGVASFFGMLVDRYQFYFVMGSLVLLALWFVRIMTSQAPTVAGLRAAIHSAGRLAVLSFGTYFLTLGFSVGIMALADWLWPSP